MRILLIMYDRSQKKKEYTKTKIHLFIDDFLKLTDWLRESNVLLYMHDHQRWPLTLEIIFEGSSFSFFSYLSRSLPIRWHKFLSEYFRKSRLKKKMITRKRGSLNGQRPFHEWPLKFFHFNHLCSNTKMTHCPSLNDSLLLHFFPHLREDDDFLDAEKGIGHRRYLKYDTIKDLLLSGVSGTRVNEWALNVIWKCQWHSNFMLLIHNFWNYPTFLTVGSNGYETESCLQCYKVYQLQCY